jgi:hypothetical protein
MCFLLSIPISSHSNHLLILYLHMGRTRDFMFLSSISATFRNAKTLFSSLPFSPRNRHLYQDQ